MTTSRGNYEKLKPERELRPLTVEKATDNEKKLHTDQPPPPNPIYFARVRKSRGPETKKI